ncbi:MAG: hypothetical protein AAGF59_13740 [Pseudomonadota bacterium]
MMIEDESPERLSLVDPPRPIAAGIVLSIAAMWLLIVTPLIFAQNGLVVGLIAALGAALPVTWGFLLLRLSQVVLDGRRHIVEIRRRSSARTPKWSVPFQEIEQLFLHRSSGPDGGRPGFQPFLATKTGSVQLSPTVYDRETAEAALDAIERFLKQTGFEIPRANAPRFLPFAPNRPQDG